MFDAIAYFQNIHDTLKATKDDFYFCKVSGMSYLEQVIQNAKRYRNFFAVDDIDDGVTFEGGGSGYYERRTYTVFLLMHYGDYGDIDARNNTISQAREIYRKILSKIIYDKVYSAQGLRYMNTDQIKFNELPGHLLTGFTGFYFTISVDNPVDLSYDASEWTE